MKSALIFFFALVTAVTATAHTTIKKDFVCPIDDTKFKDDVDASGTRFGTRLDLKPLGPFPAPGAIPQCPKCKFVPYKDNFDTKDLDTLRPFILSEPYKTAAANNSTYYALALIQEFLHETPLRIAHTYLRASWQVEANPAKRDEYPALSYRTFVGAARDIKPTDKAFVTTSILCGELERRLGHFDEAARRFNEIKTLDPFKDANLQSILDRELHFITAKDSAPHATTEETEKYVREQ